MTFPSPLELSPSTSRIASALGLLLKYIYTVAAWVLSTALCAEARQSLQRFPLTFSSTIVAPMSSRKLAEALTSALRLREICQTTPSLNAYQRIAKIAVEVCASATPSTRKKVYALAAHAVKRTDTLIKNEADIPMSDECKKGLDKFERHRIRQHIESVPERGTKFPKFGPSLTFLRESARLKGELDRVYKRLTPKAFVAPRNDCVLELATMGTRAASALCDIPIPGVNFLKPVVGMVSLICDTAKTVDGNRAAALALARHAKDVTNSIVEKVSNGEKDADSVAALRLTLEDVHAFLKLLQGRPRVASWILAAKDKDRFTELNSALDRALTVFCSAQSIGITTIVRDNTQELTTLVATVHRVEDDVKRTITLVHSNLAEYTPASDRAIAFVSLVHHFPISSFFF
ncbi:hypothetical protein K438DRAFT_1965654 [Mycena galopus ATCC 62051]|nr:hypothetical protein K438DRAFT_1965654 [Mycena galopus ATCC 62051]